MQRFENWWTLNPAFTPEFPRGWMLEEGEKIVGFIGNIPVRFVVHGEMKIAAASAAWYVDPSVRGLTSMRLFNEYLKQGNVALFLFKTEDKNLAKVLLKYGYKEYPCLSQPSEYLHIIDRVQFIRENILSLILSKYFHKGEIDRSDRFLRADEEYRHFYIFINYLIGRRTKSEIRQRGRIPLLSVPTATIRSPGYGIRT